MILCGLCGRRFGLSARIFRAASLSGGGLGYALRGARPTFNRAEIRVQRANMTGQNDRGRTVGRSRQISRTAILGGVTHSQSRIPCTEQSGR